MRNLSTNDNNLWRLCIYGEQQNNITFLRNNKYFYRKSDGIFVSSDTESISSFTCLELFNHTLME